MKKATTNTITAWPLLKTAAEMSKICGIGENRLRTMMENGEVEFLQVGSKRLLSIRAIQDYYERNKVPVNTQNA